MNAAHVNVMEKNTTVRPNYRRRRAVVGAAALIVLGAVLWVVNTASQNFTVNSMFLIMLFSLAGGGWILFNAYLDRRAEKDNENQ